MSDVRHRASTQGSSAHAYAGHKSTIRSSPQSQSSSLYAGGQAEAERGLPRRPPTSGQRRRPENSRALNEMVAAHELMAVLGGHPPLPRAEGRTRRRVVLG